mgnify:FL=1
MALKKIIGKDSAFIAVSYAKSRAIGYEGQEFVTVQVLDKKYRHSACQNDGITEGIVEWLNEEIKNNPDAQEVLERTLEADENFTGCGAIVDNKDGTYSVYNAGENQVFQLLRSLGMTLKPQKSSSRKNAVLIGYVVDNKGVEIEEDTTEA